MRLWEHRNRSLGPPKVRQHNILRLQEERSKVLKDYGLTPEYLPPPLPTHVPKGTLQELNMEQELLNQYALAQDVQAAAIANDDCPDNQRAQTLNTTTAILKELVKMQTDLLNMVYARKLESAILTALKDMPEEVKTRFFDAMDGALSEQI